MKRCIYSMSRSRSNLGDYFEDRTRPIIEHLIKLYLYPENRSVIHWRREVANLLSSTDTFKGSHKLPSAKFILRNTIEVHQPFIPSYAKQIVYEYGDSKYDVGENFDILTANIRKYFVWIANQLSVQPQILYSDIYDWLNNHGF